MMRGSGLYTLLDEAHRDELLRLAAGAREPRTVRLPRAVRLPRFWR